MGNIDNTEEFFHSKILICKEITQNITGRENRRSKKLSVWCKKWRHMHQGSFYFKCYIAHQIWFDKKKIHQINNLTYLYLDVSTIDIPYPGHFTHIDY